jgi:cytosine/uracil/thiamine/allantoin permease
VHSVGGYVTAGSLFALGLGSWQVLVALLIGIDIVNVFCNLVAKPSQQIGVPYPVICRSVFGVLGANVPAIVRELIAVAWYGIQTYLASSALNIVLLKLFPALMPYAECEPGHLITDPVDTVARIDSVFAIVLGALTFAIATVGINIVANFISPAFDFSNVNPQKISWRAGGMIAAVGSVLITPWNLYNNPEVVHYTLETLGAFIGPLC